jgi:nucleoside-diphosphate-sugar epimerase
VLKAARDAKVRRVVMTSSCGAVYYGHPPRTTPFDETSWTDIDGDMSAYVRSKAIAERAAWDFMSTDGGSLELTTINPSGIFGPILGPDFSSSIELVTRLMNGMPGVPRLYFGVVDVRDVADLHVRAMMHPSARGERFIATSGDVLSMLAKDPERASGHQGEESPDTSAAQLACQVRGALRSKAAPSGAAARQHATRHEREGRTNARLAASSATGGHSCHRREPHPLRSRRWLTTGGDPNKMPPGRCRPNLKQALVGRIG